MGTIERQTNKFQNYGSRTTRTQLASHPGCWHEKIMNNKLFTSAPIKKATNNAIVGGVYASRYTYINGYYEAASVLANTALKKGLMDLLFCPVCFNYRHYLELHLKSLIVGAEQLYFLIEELGETKGRLLESAKDQLDCIHSIEVLFKLFEERLNLVSDEFFKPDVRKTIMQLHSTDPDGQTYRYHERTSGKPSMPEIKHYDLANIRDRMKDVHDLLFGVDLWLDYHCDCANAIIDSIQPNYTG